MRNQKKTYCFIHDDSGKFYRANQQLNGDYTITKNAQPYPLNYDPTNLNETKVEFGTNTKYFSLNRSVIEPLKFIKDGAAILRNFYHLGKGTQQNAYLIIVDWDGSQIPARYTLTYKGKFDFNEKDEDPKSGTFTVALLDNSAWGYLSRNDDVTYAIDCNERNSKAIRVLFDGLTLKNNYTFQTVQYPITWRSDDPYSDFLMTLVLINEDGDSAGVKVNNQTGTGLGAVDMPPKNSTLGEFFYTAYPLQDITIAGTIKFQWNAQVPNNSVNSAGLSIKIFKVNPDGSTQIYGREYLSGPLIDGRIYTQDFVVSGLDLDANGKLFMILSFGEQYPTNTLKTVTFIVTNIVLTAYTVPQPVVVWALRPLDLLQQTVSKATAGRFSIGSNFFVENNKTVLIAGDSLRGVANAKIYTSFSDFYQTFNALFYMALRNIQGQLWMEKSTEVYKSGLLLDIGEVLDMSIAPASEMLANEIEVGSPDVDLRHPSGRLEFNSTNLFSINMPSTKKKLSIITKYHTGCFEEQFLILDYRGNSTQDNQSDNNVFVAQITDEVGTAAEEVETFENVNILNTPLEPIIKSPLTNEVITFNEPTVRGIAPAGSNINIYVDAVLDGSTSADADGNWIYNITTPLSQFIDGVQTGIHVIDATYTDLAAPRTTISITIDTAVTTPPEITYPNDGDNLYNNKPLITGLAQAGTPVDISLDGVIIASVVADNSCRWQYKVVTPFTNANHVLSVNALVDSVAFSVDSAVAFPLITYVGSELDGFIVVNNMPLIQGVALPGTVVELWLNYLNIVKLGTATADANGNWSFQVVPLTYLDPTTGTPIVVAPIQNGLNIIATSLINHVVRIMVTGYKLSRPAYSSITGVIDNTVWNTELSPQRMLKNWYPLLAAIEAKQGQDLIQFQKPGKNGNLRTVLGTEVVAENADISTLDLGDPIALLEYATIQTQTNTSFAKLLENFNAGGYVRFTYRGTELLCLPVGTMKMDSLHADKQEWKLLLAPSTTYRSLLNLYKNGTIINLMTNAIFHSDFNTLHFVTYDYQRPTRYNQSDFYDEWFNNRNDQWLLNPLYIQKFQLNDAPIIDQVITNGISNMVLRMYRCSDAFLVDTFNYVPVNPPPINTPEVVLQTVIDLSAYPEDQYFFVQMVGELMVSISERIETRAHWSGTILIESYNSTNLVGAFFSSGLRTTLRIEGHVKKLQPEYDVILSKDRNGNTKLLYSNVSKSRMIRFGTAYGLPDYIYMKAISALTMDHLGIEGVAYTLKDGETVDPADEVDGHPLFYYNVKLELVSNPLGAVFAGGDNSNRDGVILVVDALAVGLPTESLINIELDTEP